MVAQYPDFQCIRVSCSSCSVYFFVKAVVHCKILQVMVFLSLCKVHVSQALTLLLLATFHIERTLSQSLPFSLKQTNAKEQA